MQRNYASAVADTISMYVAARSLFITQPSLSASIKELENEIGVELFKRTNRGITVTPEGEEFLGYARQVVEQADLLHQHYGAAKQTRQRCSISTQHYAFAVDAFVRLIQRLSPESYEFTLRETRTHEIMEDVRNFDSEIGILYLSSFNEKVIVPCWRNTTWNSTPW